MQRFTIVEFSRDFSRFNPIPEPKEAVDVVKFVGWVETDP